MHHDIDITRAVPAFDEDPEGLWDVPLHDTERKALHAAFVRDRELRGEVEALLRGLSARLRDVFIVAFVAELEASPSARPAGAYLPALGATIAAQSKGQVSR